MKRTSQVCQNSNRVMPTPNCVMPTLLLFFTHICIMAVLVAWATEGGTGGPWPRGF